MFASKPSLKFAISLRRSCAASLSSCLLSSCLLLRCAASLLPCVATAPRRSRLALPLRRLLLLLRCLLLRCLLLRCLLLLASLSPSH